MSKFSRHYRVLQLSGPASPMDLEQAYAASIRRYMRLTARGPLRFYRHDLLADAERAYRALHQRPGATARPRETWLARKARSRTGHRPKPPVHSSVKSGNFLKGYGAIPNSGPLTPARTAAEKNHIEDDFCREVLYRLEGPLLRHRSRRELLCIASQAGIHPFRANLLMAQITESVRQHQLDRPTQYEGNGPKRPSSMAFAPQSACWLLITAGTLVLITLINILVLKRLL